MKYWLFPKAPWGAQALFISFPVYVWSLSTRELGGADPFLLELGHPDPAAAPLWSQALPALNQPYNNDGLTMGEQPYAGAYDSPTPLQHSAPQSAMAQLALSPPYSVLPPLQYGAFYSMPPEAPYNMQAPSPVNSPYNMPMQIPYNMPTQNTQSRPSASVAPPLTTSEQQRLNERSTGTMALSLQHIEDMVGQLPQKVSQVQHVPLVAEVPVDKQRTAHFVPTPRHAKVASLTVLSVEEAFKLYGSKQSAIFGLVTCVIWFFLTFLVAIYYYRTTKLPTRIQGLHPHPMYLNDGLWHYSLFGCFEDPVLCVFVCCCGSVQWSYNMHSLGILFFWVAFFLFISLLLVNNVLGSIGGFIDNKTARNVAKVAGAMALLVLVIVEVYFRQRVREKFNLNAFTCSSVSQDCVTYCCCGPCAIMQESRQIQEASRCGHQAITLAGTLLQSARELEHPV